MSTAFLTFLPVFLTNLAGVAAVCDPTSFFFFLPTSCFQYDLQKLLIMRLIQQLDNGCQELRDAVVCLAQKHIVYLHPKVLRPSDSFC